MSDKPALREQRDAHDRRARTIALLHQQANAAAAYKIARRGKIKGLPDKSAWREEATALLLAGGCFAWGLTIIGVGYLIVRGFWD